MCSGLSHFDLHGGNTKDKNLRTDTIITMTEPIQEMKQQ
jgi:hypothetical protein